eukprot:CAMPEP_0206433956 /NCGR_PEP_ID=MMETSP0324_2-20121206/8834_1 /ASSEMBLY_ACC=CAM_ASM_000836 /TAXON_ID=2866 /ORGANISM="Crypthecodinium cohnii, Strain Seligo" /LENGTH=203 /DNA_ID=CAMNT_0053900305 /DNA_START=165 /DNA_END=779 /DNA_ORIENTATION=-
MKAAKIATILLTLYTGSAEAGRPDRNGGVRKSGPSGETIALEEDPSALLQGFASGPEVSAPYKAAEDQVKKAKEDVEKDFKTITGNMEKVTKKVGELPGLAEKAGSTAHTVQKSIETEAAAIKTLHDELNKVDVEKKKLGFEVVKWLANNEETRVKPFTTVKNHEDDIPKHDFEVQKFKDAVDNQAKELNKAISGIDTAEFTK